MPTMKLDGKFIKHGLLCPEGKTRIEFCDTELPGLYVEARQTSPKQGTYYLRYKDGNKKTKHLKLGRTTEITLTQARERAKASKAQLYAGEDPAEQKKQRQDMPTLSEFFEWEYLPFNEKRKRSYRNDESLYRNRIKGKFGDVKLNALKRRQLQQWLEELKSEGLGVAQANHHIKLIRHALNKAIDWEIIEANPAARVELFKEESTIERYLSKEQTEKLVGVLDEYPNRVTAQFIKFLMVTGLRLREGLRADWDHVDMASKTMRIPAGTSKSKKPKSIPLNTTAIEILEDMKKYRVDSAIFINLRTGERYANVNKSWWDIREKAGIEEFRIHDLRHNFASVLVNNGRSLYEVQTILGHSDPKVTQRYAHLSSRATREAAEVAAMPARKPMPAPPQG